MPVGICCLVVGLRSVLVLMLGFGVLGAGYTLHTDSPFAFGCGRTRCGFVFGCELCCFWFWADPGFAPFGFVTSGGLI